MVEMVDSVFSKNMIAPIKITASIVASTITMNGSMELKISMSSMKNRSRNQTTATTKLMVVTLYFVSL